MEEKRFESLEASIGKLKTIIGDLEDEFLEFKDSLKKQKQEEGPPRISKIEEKDEFDAIFKDVCELDKTQGELSLVEFGSKAIKNAKKSTEKLHEMIGRYFDLVKKENHVELGNGYVLSVIVPFDAPYSAETLLFNDDEPVYIEECGYRNVERFDDFEELCQEIIRMKEWGSKQVVESETKEKEK
jgi:hypothetical protein